MKDIFVAQNVSDQGCVDASSLKMRPGPRSARSKLPGRTLRGFGGRAPLPLALLRRSRAITQHYNTI